MVVSPMAGRGTRNAKTVTPGGSLCPKCPGRMPLAESAWATVSTTGRAQAAPWRTRQAEDGRGVMLGAAEGEGGGVALLGAVEAGGLEVAEECRITF